MATGLIAAAILLVAQCTPETDARRVEMTTMLTECANALVQTASVSEAWKAAAHEQFQNARIWEKRAAICAIELDGERRKSGLVDPHTLPSPQPVEAELGLPEWFWLTAGTLLGGAIVAVVEVLD